MSVRAIWVIWLLPIALCLVATTTRADSPDAEFFEKRIRPVLVSRCFQCHSSTLPDPKGDLSLDTKPRLARGG